MNVFDDEAGDLTDQREAEFLLMLAEAGCTPQQAIAALNRLTEAVH
jgi:hypothetical protein